jgi:hypothetical protein
MILSENGYPLFRIMLYDRASSREALPYEPSALVKAFILCLTIAM